MVGDIRERGRTALNHLSEIQLPAVVRWLELLAELKNHHKVELEELWLLATGELKQMSDESKWLTKWEMPQLYYVPDPTSNCSRMPISASIIKMIMTLRKGISDDERHHI